MKTRHSEKRYKTADLTKMKGMYLAQRLLRTWSEDFIDEDTSEVVSIERNEIIMERGTFLDNDKLTEIKFFIDSGDVTEVDVSEIQRECGRVYENATLYALSIKLNGKGKTVYLYADHLERAVEIGTDFIEQTQAGTFAIKGVKRLDYITMITDATDEDAEDGEQDNNGTKEINTYEVFVEQTELEDGYTHKAKYILKATDVEDAKGTISDHITGLKIKENVKPDFSIVVITAKTISCDFIVDYRFTKEYLENKDKREETELEKINREILEELKDDDKK
jgi:hypothetical protein